MSVAESSKAANGMMLPKLPSEINSILVYNIAAMSYQTQNYGQALLYLKLVLENLDQVEEFIAIKSMFLLLQVLWELRMRYAATPLLDMLEAKICEIERLVEQKKLIKNQISTGQSQEAKSHTSEKEQNATQEQSEESKSWTTTGSVYEGLDDSITTKNSFCLIVGAFIRRNAVSPKTVNLHEYRMLLALYKAMFRMSQSNSSDGLLKQAVEQRGSFTNDVVAFKDEINMPAVA